MAKGILVSLAALSARQTDCVRTPKAVVELMPAGSSETWLPNHRGWRVGRTVGLNTFTSSRPLPDKSQLHNVSNSSALPMGSEGNLSQWCRISLAGLGFPRSIHSIIGKDPDSNIESTWRVMTDERSLLCRVEGWSVQQQQQQSEKAFQETQLLLALCRRHSKEHLQSGEAFQNSEYLFSLLSPSVEAA